MRGMTLALIAALLSVSTLAHAQSEKKAKPAANKGGLTSNVGNRCPGGTFNTCYASVTKAGWKPGAASSHCASTCK